MSRRSNDPLASFASRLRDTWVPGRRWTPGEATWAVWTDPLPQQVELFGDGVCWLRSHDVVIVVTTTEEANAALRLAGGLPVQIPAVDPVLRFAAEGAGWHPLVGAPFDLEVRLDVDAAGFVVGVANPKTRTRRSRPALRPALSSGPFTGPPALQGPRRGVSHVMRRRSMHVGAGRVGVVGRPR